MAGNIKNHRCDVCDGSQFSLNEGFYFCDECGAQLNQVLDLNLEVEFVQDLSKLVRKKIQKDTTENKVEITSWEVLNYILRGLVEELLSLGAKEELKETVLKMWTALLRVKEIAFFNKRQSELPKLDINFCKNDAKVLYNHKIESAKKKKDRKRQSSSAKRELQRQKKLLELSEYEEFSKSEASFSTLSSSMNSSTSGHSNKAVRLSFQPYARKRYKKMMGSKQHLAKHEVDNELELSCHSLKIKRNKLTGFERAQDIRNITLYAILYIALNMIEDDIQLSDLRRFILEGRLTLHNIQKFFPQNIHAECMKVIKAMNYKHFLKTTIFSDLGFLQSIQRVCNLVKIPDLKLPNITKLCQRYITELALPKDMMKFVERLINIYKPEMRRNANFSQLYEARAIAYIIFTLKLLFGLDDSMEHEISESSRTINATIPAANLFVFDDWMKYLEMRKVILSQVYTPFSFTYKTEGDSIRRFEFLKNEFDVEDDTTYLKKSQSDNLSRIVNAFLSKFHEDEPEQFDFTLSTLTPNATYFKTVLDSSKNLTIPDFMYSNPSETSISAHIDTKSLKSLAKDHMCKLTVEKLALRKHADIERFQCKLATQRITSKFVRSRIADFDIDLETWKQQLKEKNSRKSIFDKKDITTPFYRINRKERPARISGEQLLGNRVEIKEENLFDSSPESEDELLDVEHSFRELVFKTSAMEYWSLLGSLKAFRLTDFEEVNKKLPINLRWLIEYCANMLDANWQTIYQEVLTIEATFIHVLEPMDSVTNIIKFKDKCDKLVHGLSAKW